MKKLVALVLCALMILSMAACGNANSSSKESGNQGGLSDMKVGFIFLHDENSTYDKNFLDAAKAACKELGLKDENVILKTNIPETNDCYVAAKELVDEGCSFIFADSFGHEDFIIQAAKEFPNVQFAHATGTKAHTEKLANYHNAFASIYEGRYLAGVVAGMKLKEMIDAGKVAAKDAVVGYVGAFTYAEVISGYTSWFLGVQSIVPEATMKVIFTGSWYDQTLESEAAEALIKTHKCVLVSQHADSMGAPAMCEQNGIPNVSYNGSTVSACPNTFLVSSRIDWAPYFKLAINAIAEGKAFDTDWTGTMETGSVVLTDLNDKAVAAGTAEKLAEVKKALQDGSLHVFDTSKYTVGGSAQTSYKADVDSDADYTPDTEVIKDGFFSESEFRSAPYFDVRIDGIELINEKY